MVDCCPPFRKLLLVKGKYVSSGCNLLLFDQLIVVRQLLLFNFLIGTNATKYLGKKLRENNPTTKSIFGNFHVNITENLTKHRKILFDSTKLAKKELNFRYLWASQGRIRIRLDSESRAINISSMSDLKKLGYSEPEADKFTTSFH